MGFLEDLDSLFGTQGLYEVVGVPKTASESDIKRAYRRLSLKVHPDRVKEEEKELATRKFQALSKVYSVLSDKDLRGVYDETGEVGEEIIDKERDWSHYWGLVFPKFKLTKKAIDKVAKEYKGSREELKDLKESYLQFEGDMGEILEHIMCASMNDDDEDRFRELLQGCVDSGELPEFDAFINEDKRKKKARIEKAKKEAVEAEELAQELGVGKDSGLSSMITKRQTDRKTEMGNFFAGLEEKYSSNKNNPKKRKSRKK